LRPLPNAAAPLARKIGLWPHAAGAEHDVRRARCYFDLELHGLLWQAGRLCREGIAY
jgi:hypothetical protein